MSNWFTRYKGSEGGTGMGSWDRAINDGYSPQQIAAAVDGSGLSVGWRLRDAANAVNAGVAAQQQANQYQNQIAGYQSQIAGFESQLGNYRSQVSGLQNQYNNAMGQVSSWQTKASDFETEARDWQDQFTTKSQEYETARNEAERYRNEAVGQQLRAMKSGATTGGANSTAQQGGLASGRTQYQKDSGDGIDIDKGIKAESGTLSNKGQVVERMVSGQRRQTSPDRSPNRALASGGGSGYYATRFS